MHFPGKVTKQEQVTVSSSAVALNPPTAFDYAIVQIGREDTVRANWTSGNDPTGSNGFRHLPSDEILINSNDDAKNVTFIRDGSTDVNLEVLYFLSG